MSLRKITVSGYRGFAHERSMSFGVPNGTPGSGLTIITGSNNSGKSSILECLRARSGFQNVSFSSGKRNSLIDKVKITLDINGEEEIIQSLKKASSETEKINFQKNFEIFVLPSRRAFEAYFLKQESDRGTYLLTQQAPMQRTSTLTNFHARLFIANRNQDRFNEILKQALGFEQEWSIDLADNGQYYLRLSSGNGRSSHSSEGLGEGIVSIFAIADALYDSDAGNAIVIDEPELSLHPALQKRVFSLLKQYSAERQIIIATHSPYFISLDAIAGGASVVRIANDGEAGTHIYELSEQSAKSIKSVVENPNINNPHTLGLEAREIFFQEDGLILVEGQEDVMLYPLVAEQVGLSLPGHLFGWGVGGAENMPVIARLLQDLGFKKVAGILDSDKRALKDSLKKEFPEYFFATIAAKDIKTKKERKATGPVYGLLDNNQIRPEYIEETKSLFNELRQFMEG